MENVKRPRVTKYKSIITLRLAAGQERLRCGGPRRRRWEPLRLAIRALAVAIVPKQTALKTTLNPKVESGPRELRLRILEILSKAVGELLSRDQNRIINNPKLGAPYQ
jgi:hypothetical protein